MSKYLDDLFGKIAKNYADMVWKHIDEYVSEYESMNGVKAGVDNLDSLWTFLAVTMNSTAKEMEEYVAIKRLD